MKNFIYLCLFVLACGGSGKAQAPDLSSPNACPASANCGNPAAQCCPGQDCVDVTSDSNNCGACGTACDATQNLTCVSSNCVCSATMEACPSGTSCCAGTGCVNLVMDPKNCGTCGKTCNTLEECMNGSCLCTKGSVPAVCQAGQTCCPGGCADTQSDSANCGGCGMACAANETCASAMCVCGTGALQMACASGSECCVIKGTPICHNVGIDPNNCGACGNVCKPMTGKVPACLLGKCLYLDAPDMG